MSISDPDRVGMGDNVQTEELEDDVVTLAKMAHGTAGNLITFAAGTEPAAVVTGNATEVLTSNGAGAAPTFQAPVNEIILPLGSASGVDAGDSAGAFFFDDAAIERAYWKIPMPSALVGNQLKITIYWNTLNTTNDCYWIAYFAWGKAGERENNTSSNSDTDMISTAHGTGLDLVEATHTTTAQTFEAADVLSVELRRWGTDAADTLVGDARLWAIKIEPA